MNHHYLTDADSNDYFGFKPGNDQLTNNANRLLKGKVEQNNKAFIVVSFRNTAVSSHGHLMNSTWLKADGFGF